MDNNRRYPNDEYPRRDVENIRDGARLAQGRHPQDEYTSGQNYRNRGQENSQDQLHYGSRPDSAYRNDQNRINYGDERTRYQNQNNPRKQNTDYRNQQDYRQNYSGNQYNQNNRDFDNPPPGHHAGTRFWGEREEFKQDDYRYRSGNRGNWEAPGVYFNNEREQENRHHYRHNDNREEGFFDRMGNSINNAWNNITNNQGEDNHPNYNNRSGNRGYESGPRWADESETDYNRYERRRNYRPDDDRY